MKKLFTPICTFAILSRCAHNNINNSSNLMSNTSNNSLGNTTLSSSEIPWDAQGFSDIFELDPNPKFQITFNNENISYGIESDVTVRLEYSEGEYGYVEHARDYFGSIYDDLIVDEEKRDYKDINSFEFVSSVEFTDIFLDIYKLEFEDNNYNWSKVENEDYTSSNNSLSYELVKEDCDGYFFQVRVPYIVKDRRGFIYYIGALVLFDN